MLKLLLNNEEILVADIHTGIDTKDNDYLLYLKASIQNVNEYNEACKLRNVKKDDIIKICSSNALMRIDIECKIEEICSQYIRHDMFLDKVISMIFNFKIDKDIKETVLDLTEI